MNTYEAALREILTIPGGRHVTLPDAPKWDNQMYVMDGYERVIEIAQSALGITDEKKPAHPMDLHALGRRLLDEEASDVGV